jgi:hypothetical protein
MMEFLIDEKVFNKQDKKEFIKNESIERNLLLSGTAPI